jgi:hypothetical protein
VSAAAASTTGASASSSSSSSSSNALAISGLVLGAIGAACGIGALLFVRKQSLNSNRRSGNA